MDILFFAPLTLTQTLFNLILLCFHSYSLAIIGLSLLVNLFLNPLYWHCTQLQTQLHTIKLTLTPRLIAIRQAYSGKELGYMKKTLYRQKNYRPSMELKARLWLMLQLPLFKFITPPSTGAKEI